MIEDAQFEVEKLHRVAAQARADAAAKIDRVIAENGDIATDWIYPGTTALSGLSNIEERLWEAEIAEERASNRALIAALMLSVFGVATLAFGAAGVTGWYPAVVLVTIALIAGMGCICLFRAVNESRGRLHEARLRGFAKGAEGAFANHGRSLVAIGSTALYVARNREDIDESPFVEVVPFENLSDTECDVSENTAIIALVTPDGTSIRNLIFHHDREGALAAASRLHSRGSPKAAFNSLRRLSFRVASVEELPSKIA